MRVHLDTDFAGDTDDAAALAMLLGWPGAEVLGVTTTADPDGRRAGYVHHLLALAARKDVPVASGAGASLEGRPMGGLPDHGVYWGDAAVTSQPSPPASAVALLTAGIDSGATIIAIGPYTNLAEVEMARPGVLAECSVALMGGWVEPPAGDLPQWGPEKDWNVQCDTAAASYVFDAARHVLLVTLPATLQAHVRGADLERLEASGQVGRLLARQARAHGAEYQMNLLGAAHAGLPDDLLNFQYDPVMCAAALGWPDVTTRTMRLASRFDDEELRFVPSEEGKPVQVVLGVDGSAFSETWLTAIERVQGP